MADKYDKQKTARLPLIESVIIIAIFAVVSVIIMQMYLSADRIQKKAVNISKATILAENRAEELKAGSTDYLTRYYDNNWEEIAPGEAESGKKASFTMTSSVTEERCGEAVAMTIFRITVMDKSGEELIALDTDFSTDRAVPIHD